MKEIMQEFMKPPYETYYFYKINKYAVQTKIEVVYLL